MNKNDFPNTRSTLDRLRKNMAAFSEGVNFSNKANPPLQANKQIRYSTALEEMEVKNFVDCKCRVLAIGVRFITL